MPATSTNTWHNPSSSSRSRGLLRLADHENVIHHPRWRLAVVSRVNRPTTYTMYYFVLRTSELVPARREFTLQTPDLPPWAVPSRRNLLRLLLQYYQVRTYQYSPKQPFSSFFGKQIRPSDNSNSVNNNYEYYLTVTKRASSHSPRQDFVANDDHVPQLHAQLRLQEQKAIMILHRFSDQSIPKYKRRLTDFLTAVKHRTERSIPYRS